MQTEWIERQRDNLFRVTLVAPSDDVDGVYREFAWGKDVPREQAERESLLIVESEAD